MAIREMQFNALMKRVERLEEGLRCLETAGMERPAAPAPKSSLQEPSEKERGLAILRRAGLLVDPSPYTLALAEEWRKRPQEEREHIQAELRSLRLDPPLSEIIMQNRR